MSILNNLAERIEQGENSFDLILEINSALSNVGYTGQTAVQVALLSNSIDAARSLHKALLPMWDWDISSGSVYSHAFLCLEDHEGCFTHSGDSDSPAAAWIAAILRAAASIEPVDKSS